MGVFFFTKDRFNFLISIMEIIKSMHFYKIILFTFLFSISKVWATPVQKTDTYIYIIDADTKNLSLVSLRLYGSKNKWKEIAKWNNLADPNYVVLGQKLIIKQKP
ncbi:MAG: LysM peptidoglycan-binding domain-containing protein, partial [Bdellovibrionales bacterium]|nr:LysM peptidoglycan-binding domain-containing protein [Bdellovibrionales bacterium]